MGANQPTCDSCFAPLFAEDGKLVCPKDPSHDVYPLRGLPVGTREQPCATCGGHVVCFPGDDSHTPTWWWCRVDPSHDVG